MFTPIALMVFILAIIHPFLRKWIVGEKGEKISATDGKNIYIWGNIILALIAISLVFFVLDIYDENTIKWFFLILMIIVFSFQSIIEWKYIKNSKEYAVTLLLLLFGLIYFFLFIF